MRYLPNVTGGKQTRGIIDLPVGGDAPVWIDPNGDLKAGTLHDNRIAFTSVDSVLVDFNAEGRQPNLSVFTVDSLGVSHETFPSITYNENTKTVLVSFGSTVESGYIVVN
ncbi:MAG: hypothetical protein ACR2NF_08795 [Pirellulales bacterium]